MNEKLKEAISEAIREALGGALDCTRVWSAWGVGTMSEDDFSPVADDSERVGEIADAVMAVLTTRKLVCETCSGWGMIGGPSFYAPDEGGEPCPDCSASQPVAYQSRHALGPLGGDGWGHWTETGRDEFVRLSGLIKENPEHFSQLVEVRALGVLNV